MSFQPISLFWQKKEEEKKERNSHLYSHPELSCSQQPNYYWL